MDISAHRHHLADHQMDFIGQSQVVYHCHHFNLFFDQTIDDALGTERGTELRTRAAHKASYQFLRGLFDRSPASSPVERLTNASQLFAGMGHGKLNLLVTREGGEAQGSNLHYGFAWREKYGGDIGRKSPADAFAAGFTAAAAEVAYNLSPGGIQGDEVECIATGAAACRIKALRSNERFATRGVILSGAERGLPVGPQGQSETSIRPIAEGLRGFLGGVAGDARGLVEAFGVLVTLHLADYYNHAANDTLAVLVKEKPHVVEVFRSLLQESGTVCAFNTFGGIMASPEWEGMVGAPSGDPNDVVVGCLAIARALGFGSWTLEELVPGRKLVLASAGTYESIYAKTIVEPSLRGSSGFFLGAAVGIMQLAHDVTWVPSPGISQDVYLRLAAGNKWAVDETHSLAAGDDVDRVIITRR